MQQKFIYSLLMAALAFGAGVSFQKWIGVGRLRGSMDRQPVVKALSNRPSLKNESTYCLLALGQSNAANHGSTRANAGGNAYVLSRGTWFPAVDPIPGASSLGGSVWTRLAPRLLAREGQEAVVVSSIAQGSSYVRDWMPGGIHHPKLASAVSDFQSEGLEIDVVVWHQGESEAWNAASDGTQYRRDLELVLRGIRDLGVDAPIFVCQTSRDAEGVVNEAVRQAQASVWSDSNRVFAGADTDSLGARFRADGVHFNDTGLGRFAALLDEAIQRCSVRDSTRHEP